jgi:hypothetical protein
MDQLQQVKIYTTDFMVL